MSTQSTEPGISDTGWSRATAGARRVRFGSARDYGVLICFLVLFLFLTIDSQQFLTKSNMLNLVDQSTDVGIIACAGTLVMIAGGFDLSVGAMYAVSGIVSAEVLRHAGVVPGVAAGLACGTVMGTINGLMVTVGKINAFIATLASSIVFGGVALAVTNGFFVEVTNAQFQELGQSRWLGVLWSSWIFLGFAVCMGFILSRTVLGRYIYATGGSAETARLSGIGVGTVTTVTFVLSGFASGLAGILYVAKVSSADPSAGTSLPLSAIAAVVLGGTSITGGQGAMWRTIVGVFFFALISNGFVLLGLNPTYEQIVEGLIIAIAVGIDARARRVRG